MSTAIFDSLVYQDDVGEGESLATFCRLDGIAKLAGEDHPHLVANEFIAARLGLLIGVPTVPGVVVRREKEPLGYVSLRFGRKGEALPRLKDDRFVRAQPHLAWGVIAFDCWIANRDRHRANLAWSDSELHLFDHDRAVLGAPSDTFGQDAHLLERHCLAAEIHTVLGRREWCEQISAVRDEPVAAIVHDAVRAGALAQEHEDLVCSFLAYRKKNIGAILLSAEKDGTFRRLPKLSMFP